MLATLATALLLSTAQAQEPLDVELHRPGAFPDRVVLTWAEDPTTTQAVTWRTSTEVPAGQAQVGIAEDGPGFDSRMATVAAKTQALTTDLGAAHYHTVRFTGLTPSTRYQYRVGDGRRWSEWFHFRTASDKPEPFEFLYSGDAQNGIRSDWSRVLREAVLTAPRARFILHAGDLIDRASSDAQWGEWHLAAGWINATIPVIATPGNHEYGRQADGTRALSTHWRPQFELPSNGLPGLEETNYVIDYQGLRIISLNSNVRIAEQAAWLDRRLSENPNRWTIVTFHHPVFSSARGRDNKEVRDTWKPVFDRHRVDLVLQGHDHTYARSSFATAERGQQNGTVYVVSVGGVKMYNLEREPWMARAAEDTQLFQVIRIDGDRLTYESRTATGRLYDAFELRKRAGQPNRLIDRRPNTPERLRPKAGPG